MRGSATRLAAHSEARTQYLTQQGMLRSRYCGFEARPTPFFAGGGRFGWRLGP